MNKKFEQEYREFIKKSTPDIWDRIDAGISASERTNSVISSDVSVKTPLPDKKIERIHGKKISNYYQIMAIAGAAACFALLAIGSPIVKQSMRIEKEAQEGNEIPDKESTSSGLTSETETEPETGVAEKETTQFVKESGAKEVPTNDGTEKEQEKTGGADTSEKASQTETKETPKDVAKAEVKDTAQSSAAKDVSPAVTQEPVKTENQSNTVAVDSASSVKENNATTEQKKKKKTSSSETDLNLIASTPITDGSAVATTGMSASTAATTASSSSSSKAASSSAAVSTSSSAAHTGSSSAKAATGEDEAAAAAKAAAEEAAKAAEAAKAQAEEAAKAAEEAAKAQTRTEETEQKKTPEVFNQVKVKVSSVKGNNGEIIYTVKVLEDGSGSFKKGKSLKMASAFDLQKGESYVISFADDGSKTGSKVLYTVLSAEALPEEE